MDYYKSGITVKFTGTVYTTNYKDWNSIVAFRKGDIVTTGSLRCCRKNLCGELLNTVEVTKTDGTKYEIDYALFCNNTIQINKLYSVTSESNPNVKHITGRFINRFEEFNLSDVGNRVRILEINDEVIDTTGIVTKYLLDSHHPEITVATNSKIFNLRINDKIKAVMIPVLDESVTSKPSVFCFEGVDAFRYFLYCYSAYTHRTLKSFKSVGSESCVLNMKSIDNISDCGFVVHNGKFATIISIYELSDSKYQDYNIYTITMQNTITDIDKNETHKDTITEEVKVNTKKKKTEKMQHSTFNINNFSCKSITYTPNKHYPDVVKVDTYVYMDNKLFGVHTMNIEEFSEEYAVKCAIINGMFKDGKFSKVYDTYTKKQEKIKAEEYKKLCTCNVCGTVFDTPEEAVDCQKQHELNKRIKKIKAKARRDFTNSLDDRIYQAEIDRLTKLYIDNEDSEDDVIELSETPTANTNTSNHIPATTNTHTADTTHTSKTESSPSGYTIMPNGKKSYSADFKKQVVDFYRKVGNLSAAATKYGVVPSTVYIWNKQIK